MVNSRIFFVQVNKTILSELQMIQLTENYIF